MCLMKFFCGLIPRLSSESAKGFSKDRTAFFCFSSDSSMRHNNSWITTGWAFPLSLNAPDFPGEDTTDFVYDLCGHQYLCPQVFVEAVHP